MFWARVQDTDVSSTFSRKETLVEGEFEELFAVVGVAHETDERPHLARTLRLRDDVSRVDEGLDLLVPVLRGDRVEDDAGTGRLCCCIFLTVLNVCEFIKVSILRYLLNARHSQGHGIAKLKVTLNTHTPDVWSAVKLDHLL